MLNYQSFWAEAVNTANYVFNRMPKDSEISPLEQFFGQKTNLNTFHRFESEIYVKIPDQRRRKLDVKAERMKFIGYDERCYEKLIVSQKKIGLEEDYDFEYDEVQEQQNKANESEIQQESNGQEKVDNELEQCQINVEEDLNVEKELNVEEENIIEIPEEGNQEDEEDTLSHEEPQLRRSSRTTAGKLPAYLNDYIIYMSEEIEKVPTNFCEAKEYDVWMAAMNEELQAIAKNNTWDLVDLPKGISLKQLDVNGCIR